ncbi:MAG TPA: dienelactone hydrolase family protein [Solimonas sp.]
MKRARIGWGLVLGLLCTPLLAAPRVERVAFTLDDGRRIEAELRGPAGRDAPLPVVLLFGGFRGAATVLDAVPSDLPLIAASFDYPFDPPRRFRFPQSFGDLPALKRGIDQTFEGIEQLVAHLRSRDDVDAQRITIVGASLGAPFAVISAAELDLPGVVLVHGFGEVRRVIAQQFIRKLEPRYGAWARAPSWGLANAITWGFRLPAPEDYASRLRASQRVLMITAGDDDLIPAQATETLWQSLQASQARVERVDQPGVHLRGTGDARIADLVGQALRWMGREGLR